MKQKEKVCCKPAKDNPRKRILLGIIYGILPHTFCIAFVLFSVIGAVAATAFLKKMLVVPYFFYLLALISLLLATISSIIYLKRSGCLCASGIKGKGKYIATLYSTTILVNLLMFFFVLPALANTSSNSGINQGQHPASLAITVQIPCPGHAPLIINELKKDSGVGSVKFKMPDIFEIKYDPKKTSPEKMTSSEIFKIYKPSVL